MAPSTSTIEKFVDEVRRVFATVKDPRAQAQSVAKHMKDLLVSPGLMAEIHQRGGGRSGRVDLHVDEEYGHPAPGFCLMTSIPGGEERPGARRPHDHGASYVVYGVYKGAIEQVKYKWTYPKEGSWTSPELKESDRFVQREGDVAFFLPGEIHKTSPVGDAPPIVVRLEAQRLDRVLRHAYSPEKQAVLLQKGLTPAS